MEYSDKQKRERMPVASGKKTHTKIGYKEIDEADQRIIDATRSVVDYVGGSCDESELLGIGKLFLKEVTIL